VSPGSGVQHEICRKENEKEEGFTREYMFVSHQPAWTTEGRTILFKELRLAVKNGTGVAVERANFRGAFYGGGFQPTVIPFLPRSYSISPFF
jgi:hypothetical protein